MKLSWRRACLSAGLAVLAACVPKLLPIEMGSPKWGAEVTWHGHSCFTIRDSIGRTVVIDPFDETVGYGRLSLRADALLISHEHFDHDYKRAVLARGRDIELVESTGTATVASGLIVTGIPSYHDNEGGQINGSNRIYTFVLGGLRFAHLGDFGEDELSDYEKKMIGHVDVLLIPVGGVVTIDAEKAKRIVDDLQPAFVFPMHYGNIRFYHLDPVEKFLALFPLDQVVQLRDSHVRLHLSDFKEKPIVYTLLPTETN